MLLIMPYKESLIQVTFPLAVLSLRHPRIPTSERPELLQSSGMAQEPRLNAGSTQKLKIMSRDISCKL